MDNFKEGYRLKLRRTKIVATIGVASESEEIMGGLIQAGINLARLNFSHGTHESHGRVVEGIRRISKDMRRRVALLGDLCGPKIRVGKFESGSIRLRAGDQVAIDTQPGVVGREGLIPSQYQNLIQDIQEGQRILFDDGLLEVQVTRIENENRAACEVKRGGVLKNHKGMNIPGAALSVPALTEKDYKDLQFAIRNRLEYVALSFVRRAEEIWDLKRRIAELTEKFHQDFATKGSQGVPRTRVIAKIEKPEALEEIEGIVDEADGIMIARGDLGVEMPPERVPIIQNELIRLANARNKPVIVATQMLESMIENTRPTRAEVSDVANAVLGKTDAVMLSGETAAGKNPIEAVQYMDRIVRELESHQWAQGAFGRLESNISVFPLPNSLARACTLLSQDMEIRAINVLTRSGRMARVMSTARPNCPILAYTNDPMTATQMQLYWGVYPFELDSQLTLETFGEVAADMVKELDIAKTGHHILLVSSPLKSQAVNPMNSIIVYEIP